MLNNFIQNPFVNLLSCFVLLLTSGYEVWSTIEEFSVGAHHGLFFFSLVQILKVFPEIFQAAKEFNVSIK
jgi:hypothetical protein